FGHRVGGIRQDAHDVHIADVHHQLEGAGVQKVSYQDAGSVAPLGIGCQSAATERGYVHHVVVEQRGGVNEFNNSGQLEVFPPLIAKRAAGEQGQKGAQAFAAGLHQVVANVLNELHIRV